MRKTERRKYLRWLLPVLVYFVITTVVLAVYKKDYQKKTIKAKEAEIAIAIGDEVKEVDMSLQRALSYMGASSDALSFYAMEYNRNQVLAILKGIEKNTDIMSVVVCDQKGNGYNEQGNEVFVGNEGYFSEVQSEYSRGGSGMVLSGEVTEDNYTEAVLVSSVTFVKKEKGFMIAKIPIIPISEKLFIDRYLADRVSVVTLDGMMLTSTYREAGKEKNFWDLLPVGISRDTLKLSISQKNTYMAEIPGYGYVLAIPMDVVSGGVIALITYNQMESMTKGEMGPFWSLAYRIMLASIALVIMIIVANILGNIILEKMRRKMLSKVEMDEVTGLLTRNSAEKEIYHYIENAEDGGGLMFLIGIEGVKLQTNIDKTVADARRKEFAKMLMGSFRASDILARVDDDRFLVFMKGINDEKNIRKQTDEMQMFLHDIDIHDAAANVMAYAGAALYPKNGRNVTELINAAESAYERSKGVGAGRLSF